MDAPEIILVMVYTVLFSFAILHLKFFRSFYLPVKLITAIYIFKIVVGIFYGYLHLLLYQGGDTYAYFDDSKIVFSSLRSDPWLYIRLVFGFSHANPAADITPYKDAMMYYTTPGSYLLVRFHALLRLISFGYYNVHVVFYNFITLTGILYLFRFLVEILPAKKNLLIVAVFLFPSVVFWSSGMHKDGISMAALGLILFTSKEIFFPTNEKSFLSQLKLYTGWVTGLVLLFFIRNFLLLLLIPVLIAWVITVKYPKHKLIKYVVVLMIYFGITSNLNSIDPEWNFLNRIVFTQNEFKAIADGSLQIPIPAIVPTIASVLKGIPMALENCLLRPWFAETKNGLQLISAIENILLLLLLFTAIIFKKKKLSAAEQSLLLFSLCMSITIFIVVGITVPILGALVRYKMVGVLFLLIGSIALVKDEWVPVKFLKS